LSKNVKTSSFAYYFGSWSLIHKGGSVKLSVFKGREAKLNRAIFNALAIKGPLTAFEIYKYIRSKRIFRRKLYSVVNRRIRRLEAEGFLVKIGRKLTKAGFTAPVYRLTAKAYLAILLSTIDFDHILTLTDDESALKLLAALVDFANMSVF